MDRKKRDPIWESGNDNRACLIYKVTQMIREERGDDDDAEERGRGG